jgi:hypothetical protein
VSAPRITMAFALCGGIAMASAACGLVAGLPSDYELASDGGAADGSVSQGDAASDAAAVDEARAVDAAANEAAANDASDAAVDAPPKAPKVPPSDPANVACGTTKCAVLARVCCEDALQASCQDRNAINCSGVVGRCDEAANCFPGEVCCVTDIKSYGLETSCQQSCSGSDPRACRKDSECASGETCVAWTCNGRVVATCDGRGSDAGCH